MANISALLEIIRTAHLGRDMRQALHDSIDAVNDDVETCGQTLNVSSDKLQLKHGSTVLSEVPMPSGNVNSVNGQTGDVELDADDISDSSTTNKFVTDTEKQTWNGKSVVSVTQIKSSGEKIATINVNGTDTDLYASAGGGGGGAVDSVNGMTGDVVLDVDDINDVDINNLADGQTLVYDATSGKWVNGSGGGGTSDYTDLTNKPQINGVTLSGNKSASDLLLQGALDFTSTPSVSNKVVCLNDLPIINVKDYGAVGDGVTDDSTAIQSALDVGGIIFFPDGDYVIETTLVPTDYSTLLGNNRQTARLKAKGCDAINLSNHNMVSIINMCISPHADNVGQYTAIDLNNCNRPSIKNVLIGKFNYGIYSHTGTNWDIYCEDVYFSEPNVGIYHPDLTSQLHIIMHKCYFYGGTTTKCIDLHSTRGEFYDCRFGCQNSRAVNITDLSKLLFIGCDFEADSVITMGTEPNNTMVHIGDGFYNFINCTFVGNDYFSAGYLMQLWYTNSCQFNDCSWQGVANQYKFNIAYMGDNTLGNVYFNGLSFNPLYNYLKTNKSSIIKHIRNRYCTSQEYATRPNTADLEPYSIYHNINSNFLEYYDGTNWEILDHHTWIS